MFVSVIYNLFKKICSTPLLFFLSPSPVSFSLNWLVLHVARGYTIARIIFNLIPLDLLRSAAQTAEYNHIHKSPVNPESVTSQPYFHYLAPQHPKRSLLVFSLQFDSDLCLLPSRSTVHCSLSFGFHFFATFSVGFCFALVSLSRFVLGLLFSVRSLQLNHMPTHFLCVHTVLEYLLHV